ncbi:hypothetical protein F4780DRAFT_738172 [Xylariomycetidae sp. FL0641]|nr:hypothetical protein F4780DRAFT_738172 [Xylariomycetidae sp. FL0641]
MTASLPYAFVSLWSGLLVTAILQIGCSSATRLPHQSGLLIAVAISFRVRTGQYCQVYRYMGCAGRLRVFKGELKRKTLMQVSQIPWRNAKSGSEVSSASVQRGLEFSLLANFLLLSFINAFLLSSCRLLGQRYLD